MNMNTIPQFATKEKSTIVERKRGGWGYAFSQYITMLKRWSGKFVYLVQWSLFNFGFHMIICCGKIKFIFYIILLQLFTNHTITF